MIPPSLIAAGILAFVAFTAGWQIHSWKTGAEQLKAERASAELLQKTVEGWNAAVQKITGDRERERQIAAADRREFTRSLSHAKPLVECPAVDQAAAAADPRLSPEFVRLWNAALEIGLPDTLRSRRADGTRPGPGAVEPNAVLANLADNAESCNELRGKLLAWQAWARSIGAAR
jgi:hypothetical protein